ncbi:MAG: hypothetical protein AB1813_12135 [Verrucomicrobiota bacterium]
MTTAATNLPRFAWLAIGTPQAMKPLSDVVGKSTCLQNSAARLQQKHGSTKTLLMRSSNH